MSKVFFDNQSTGKVALYKSGLVQDLDTLLLSMVVEYYYYRKQYTQNSNVQHDTLIPLLLPFGLNLEQAEDKVNEWRAKGLLVRELKDKKVILTLNLSFVSTACQSGVPPVSTACQSGVPPVSAECSLKDLKDSKEFKTPKTLNISRLEKLASEVEDIGMDWNA